MSAETPSLLDAILGGLHDAELAEIAGAIRDREKIVQRRAASALSPGDTVKFSDSIRPKYLVGLPVTVVKINPQSIVVNCPSESAYGRFSGAKRVRCPLALIAGAGA